MASEISKKLAKHKKTGRLYNKDTGLVFNSAEKDRLVIGRLDNDEFVPLDQEAVDLCEKHGVKYDESLVEVEEGEEEDVPDAVARAPETKGKKPAKKSEKEEEKEEEEEIPEAKPAPPKKATKKVSSEEEEKPEESEEPAPAKKASVVQAKENKTATSGTTSGVKGDFLSRHAKELEDYIASVRQEGETAKNRVQELEKEVENLKLEVAKRDKKIKAFLSE